MIAAAIILIILAVAYVIIGSLKGWKVQYKLVGIVLVVSVGFLLINNYINPKDKPQKQAQIPQYELIAPNLPYVIKTPSRIYYTDKYLETGSKVTMLSYYTYDKKQWVLSNKAITLDRNIYGDIKIYKR